MAKKSYFEKLKDPKWQEKRLRILDRAGFACEWCGTTDTTLHVHHGYYTRGKEPWEYGDDTLYCLCEHCHDETESLKHDLHIEVARLHPKYLRELFLSIQEFKARVEAGQVPQEVITWQE